MLIQELLKLREARESEFGEGTSISDYKKYADWIEAAHEKCFDKFDEDEAKWKAFEKALAFETSADQVKVFMGSPSADALHYNSNGRPDGGDTLEFLENFNDFKSAFESVLRKA